MAEKEQPQGHGVSIGNMLQGIDEVVNTQYGPVIVTILGDRLKAPCVAYHETGLNARTCFRSLLVASGPQSLLMKNYYIILIHAPGHESPTGTVPPQILPITLDKLATQVQDVATHYNLREVVGLGVGNGGNVMIQFAANNPKLMAGLILISPTCRKCGWIEWASGSVTARQLQLFGWSGGVQNHFMQRLFGNSTLQLYGGDSDLVKAMKRDLEEVDSKVALQYFWAALGRKDISDYVKKLTCRVLLLYGGEGLYQQESLDFGSTVDKRKFAIIEVPEAGVLVNEERPGELLSPLQLFFTALQLEGYGLGESLMVGE